MWYLAVSESAEHYSCLTALNCTGKNMSTSLMYGLGEADGNNYICSKDLRPGKSYCFPLFFISLCCRALKLAKLECVTLPFLPLYLSRPRFLAETESRKRRLNQGSFVSAVSAVCLVVYFL